VQWHPEYQQHAQDTQLLNAFVVAASRYQQSMRSAGKAMTEAMNDVIGRAGDEPA
jgi:putative glutamine amidotransferase